MTTSPRMSVHQAARRHRIDPKTLRRALTSGLASLQPSTHARVRAALASLAAPLPPAEPRPPTRRTAELTAWISYLGRVAGCACGDPHPALLSLEGHGSTILACVCLLRVAGATAT